MISELQARFTIFVFLLRCIPDSVIFNISVSNECILRYKFSSRKNFGFIPHVLKCFAFKLIHLSILQFIFLYFISPFKTLEVCFIVSKCMTVFAIDFYFYSFCVINFEDVLFVLKKKVCSLFIEC